MHLGLSDTAARLRNETRDFVEQEILPAEGEFFAEVSVGSRWQLTSRQEQILESLKTKARSAGLWNFFLSDDEHGSGLSTVEYAYLAEEMGKSRLAAEVFNCSAPDTGNMEVLNRYGSEAQKQEWLIPLLNGEIRSAYAMTEPGVASSDATNISTTATVENDEWVINGEKHYVSGAGDPRCKIIIVMAMTDPDAPRHRQHSQILVPASANGIENVRAMSVFGSDKAPHGHMYQRYTDVRVPLDNVILGRGRGFEISQGRLGPGRIHHCMRALGAAERALSLLCKRSLERTAFGKPLARLGGNLDIIADARMDIEMARLLTLKTAWMMDNADPQEARNWISMTKAVVPKLATRIIDESIQLHGALGVSDDTPLAEMYADQRVLRLADGPDEVHRMVVGRSELRRYERQRL